MVTQFNKWGSCIILLITTLIANGLQPLAKGMSSISLPDGEYRFTINGIEFNHDSLTMITNLMPGTYYLDYKSGSIQKAETVELLPDQIYQFTIGNQQVQNNRLSPNQFDDFKPSFTQSGGIPSPLPENSAIIMIPNGTGTITLNHKRVPFNQPIIGLTPGTYLLSHHTDMGTQDTSVSLKSGEIFKYTIEQTNKVSPRAKQISPDPTSPNTSPRMFSKADYIWGRNAAIAWCSQSESTPKPLRAGKMMIFSLIPTGISFAGMMSYSNNIEVMSAGMYMTGVGMRICGITELIVNGVRYHRYVKPHLYN